MAKNRIFSVLREYHILEQDLVRLFEYIEPTDKNLGVYSHRLFELLLRACTAVESNLKKLCEENNITHSRKDFDMCDYFKCEKIYSFSKYQVKMPSWRTEDNSIEPFEDWIDATIYKKLFWYEAYNTVKHNVQSDFSCANLKNVRYSIAGLFVLLYAQYGDLVFNQHQDTTMSTTGSDKFVFSGNSLFSIKRG